MAASKTKSDNLDFNDIHIDPYRAGYFFLWRAIWDSTLNNAVNPTAFKMAIYCISRANYAEATARKGDTIFAGSFVTSRESLAAALHISERTVGDCLSALKEIGFIKVKSTGRGTLITVRHYSQFQTELRTAKNCHSDKQKTADQNGRLGTTNNTYSDNTSINNGGSDLAPFAAVTSSDPCGSDLLQQRGGNPKIRDQQSRGDVFFDKEKKCFMGEGLEEFRMDLEKQYGEILPVEKILNGLALQASCQKTPILNARKWLLASFEKKFLFINKEAVRRMRGKN